MIQATPAGALRRQGRGSLCVSTERYPRLATAGASLSAAPQCLRGLSACTRADFRLAVVARSFS
jgi:hypothetical protein